MSKSQHGQHTSCGIIQMKFKIEIGKYMSPEEKRNLREAEDFDKKFHLSNWHEFLAIFPRKIVTDGIVYFAIGKMWRRGEWVFKSKSEDYVTWGWNWEYTDKPSGPQRMPNKTTHGGKRIA